MRSCRDVSGALARDALEGAPLRDRVAVRLHLLFCRHCRRYAEQLRAIGEAARRIRKPREGDVSRQVLDRLRSRILGGDEGRGGGTNGK